MLPTFMDYAENVKTYKKNKFGANRTINISKEEE